MRSSLSNGLPISPSCPNPRRARPRLSVRVALVGIAVIALLLSTWAAFFDPALRWKRAIHDDNEGGRRWEAASRGVMGRVPGVTPEMVLEELTAALGDPSFRVRQTSASSLGSLGPKGEAVVPALAGALKDGHPWVREAAARSLGDILEKAPGRRGLAVPALVAVLKDGRFDVRMAAAFALAQINEGEAALPVLIEALSRQDQMTRSSAIWAIGKAGPKGRPAVPALRATAAACANDRDPYMRLRRVEAAQVLFALGETTDARRMILEASNDPNPIIREAADRALKDLPPMDLLP